jgi:1,4-dihydroxy-6-naphthoate synthase
MKTSLSLGYSPCPNDTFIFFAMAQGIINLDPYEIRVSLADVEALNQAARRQELDITKTSMSALVHLLEKYWLLRAGGALGRGCGPLVVARRKLTMKDLAEKAIAIPGRLTTAHMLLQLEGTHVGPRVEMEFSRIMPAVVSGEVDAGVIIHEGRFTYGSLGLELVLDLGEWWEHYTGLPLPLGGILMRRDLGAEAARTVEAGIRDSLLYARAHPEQAWPYIREHAQEMEPRVIQQHIDMFVNDFTIDLGIDGEDAVRRLMEAASRQQSVPLPDKPVFWNES